MKLRNLYLINAAVALVFAIALLLMTPILLGLFGMDNTKDAVILGQLLAVELTVGGLTTLLARDVTDQKARSAINIGNLVASVLGFIITLSAILTNVFNWLGYVILAIYAFFAIAFAYFQFFKPSE